MKLLSSTSPKSPSKGRASNSPLEGGCWGCFDFSLLTVFYYCRRWLLNFDFYTNKDKMKNILDKLTLSVVPLKSALKSLRIFKISYTPKRLCNVVKIISSMYLSRILKKPVVWGLPPILMIEPTNICNLKCPMCPAIVGKRVLSKGQLKLDNYKKLLDEVGDTVFQVQLWNQGEPFINKDFLEMVRYAKTYGIMTITSTNAHFVGSEAKAEEIVKSGLDQLIISMDGTNQETYEKYRVNGDYNLVLQNLIRLARAKKKLNSKTPLIELQFIVFKHNQDEIDTIIHLAKEYDIDRLSFKTPMVYSAEQADEFLVEAQKKELYRFDEQNVSRKPAVPDWCKRLWLNSTVNWDGTVVPCCFDADSDHIFANVFENGSSFKSTWKNKKYTAFRQALLKNRSAIDMCRNCTEGMPEPYAKIMEIS